MNIMIRDVRWKVRKVKPSHPEVHGAVASANPNNHTIYITEAGLDRGTILHEIFHAYCFSLFARSDEITKEGYEEIIASMLEEYYDVIGKQATKILKELS